MSSKWKSKSNSSKGFEMSDKSYQLSKNRFVSVSEFRNQMRVDIREYYFDDTGDRKPGKKGINLSLEEWNKLKNFVPKIERALKGSDVSDDDSDDDKPIKSKKSKKSDSESNDDSDDGHKKSKRVKSRPKDDSDSDDKQKKSKKSKEVLSDSDSSD